MIKFKLGVKYWNSINFCDFLTTEFKAYLTEDKSKYITLVTTSWVEQRDDNGKKLGDVFTIMILEKDIAFELFIPQNEPFFTFQIGKEIYGFKINYDIKQ